MEDKDGWLKDAQEMRDNTRWAEMARRHLNIQELKNLLKNMKNNYMYNHDGFNGYTDTVCEFDNEIKCIEKDFDELCRTMIERFQIFEKQDMEYARGESD